MKERPDTFEGSGRKILVYDFTAHKCINCPSGHEAIEELEELYGDSLIVTVSIHCTDWADIKPPQAGTYTYDFRTPIGDELGGRVGQTGCYYGTLSLPIGLVNNLSKDELLSHTGWASATDEVISTPSDFKISIAPSFSADSTISCEVSIQMKEGENRQFNLVTFLTEDSIHKDQSTHEGTNPNYTHNNVLRAGFNGTWGESIPVNTQSITKKTYQLSAKNKDWQISNCKIVAFLYDVNSYEVLQAEKVHIQ